jgi:hypothetical protein
VAEATGLVAEVRAEGIAMVDPEDELTDIKMLAQGMQSHATLLLAELIAARPDGVRRSDVGPGSEYLLVANALASLRALRLISLDHGDALDRLDRRDEPLVTARPAIARYALAEPARPDRQSLPDLPLVASAANQRPKERRHDTPH